MTKKGQMSLEMVIGLVILLVVAGVVISLLLHYLGPGSMPNPGNRMNRNDFISECNRLCDDRDIEYCSYYFDGNDYNLNGQSYELIKLTDVKWDVCEDRVYCFFAVPCKRFGDVPMKGCAKALCNAYKTKKYKGNLTAASIAVLRDIVSTTDPECNASLYKLPLVDNWKASFFNATYGNQSLCEYYIG
jgi:hypothetical protein